MAQSFSCVPSAEVSQQGQCPIGYVEQPAQVFVALDGTMPGAETAASIFAIGFLAAFSTARVVSMIIRAVVDLVKS